MTDKIVSMKVECIFPEGQKETMDIRLYEEDLDYIKKNDIEVAIEVQIEEDHRNMIVHFDSGIIEVDKYGAAGCVKTIQRGIERIKES